MDPLQLPTPADIADNPELASLAILDSALDISATAILAQYPEIHSPDWPLDSHPPPDPPTYAANVLLTLLGATRTAVRSYRETILRSAARLAFAHTDHNEHCPF